jgi:hypothetical protein
MQVMRVYKGFQRALHANLLCREVTAYQNAPPPSGKMCDHVPQRAELTAWLEAYFSFSL